MNNIFIRLGKAKSCLLIVSISVITSFIFTFSITYYMLYLNYDINLKASMIFSIIVPLVISAPISWYTIGLIIEVHSLKDEIEKLANYDVLTNLLTRRAFILKANACIEVSKRKNEYVSLLIIDLDYFKRINDEYGHPVGDKVLVDFSNILKNNFRKADILCRFGGEEFICLLSNTNEEKATLLVERLFKKVRENRFYIKGKHIKYTMSIGIKTEKIKNSFSIDTCIQDADKALYIAKNEGRDCFRTFTE